MNITIGMLMVTTVIGVAQTTVSEPTSGTQDAALKGLSTLRGLITPDDLPLMGVESITAFNKTELGAPIPIYFVSLREIRSFEHGSDPNALLKVREKFLYPVKLGDLIVSSMVIQETKKGWKATNLGDINLAKRVTKLISDGVTANRIDASRYFLTEIPALSLLFVTHRTDGGLVLQSVSDIEDIDVKAAVEEPAEKIFEALKPFSQGSYLSPS